MIRALLGRAREADSCDNPHTVSREVLVERVGSASFVAALSEPDRETALAQFRALLDDHPETRVRDEITIPYRTEVHLLRKVP